MDMLAVTTSAFADPSGYALSTVPRPSISEDTDVLIRVYAASINPVDVKKAAGVFKFAVQEKFPYKIGYDCAGIVEAIGASVSDFQVGDEVYVRLPEISRGSWSEYVVCPAYFVAPKPPSLSFDEAAAMPLAATTALQTLRKYPGSLSGKTVFIPAGLSGTGSFALQVAKKVFGAGKVITTVSTSKVDKIPQLLGTDTVDQVIDYTKSDPKDIIPAGSVDFLLDTSSQAMDFLSLMKPGGMIISISTQPSGDQLQAASVMKRRDNPKIPFLVHRLLNVVDTIRRFRARRWNVQYEYLFLDPNGKDLRTITKFVEDGKLAPVIGSKVDLRDIEQLKDAAAAVHGGKGGIGKTVISVIKESS